MAMGRIRRKGTRERELGGSGLEPQAWVRGKEDEEEDKKTRRHDDDMLDIHTYIYIVKKITQTPLIPFKSLELV